MDRALALEDPVDSVYLLMRKSNITCDRGHPASAVMLAEAAERALGKVPPRVRAVVLAQRARAHALRGAANDCARSLDDAAHEAMRPGCDADPIAAYCTPEYVAMEAAACWLALGHPAKAIPIFERALKSWPAGQRRDLGVCQARLTVAYAAAGDPAGAAEVGMQAGTTLQSAASARALRELNRAREILTPWRREPRIAELIATVKGLNYVV